MAYILFNCQDGRCNSRGPAIRTRFICLAKASPSLVADRRQPARRFQTQYRLQTHYLKPGDKLLLYTDGMDGASFEQHPGRPRQPARRRRAFPRALPIDELVDRLASDLFTQTRQADDLTVFGMEMT